MKAVEGEFHDLKLGKYNTLEPSFFFALVVVTLGRLGGAPSACITSGEPGWKGGCASGVGECGEHGKVNSMFGEPDMRKEVAAVHVAATVKGAQN